VFSGRGLVGWGAEWGGWGGGGGGEGGEGGSTHKAKQMTLSIFSE